MGGHWGVCVCVCVFVCMRERKETGKYRDRERKFVFPLNLSRAWFHAVQIGYSIQTIISHLHIQAAEETEGIP